MVCHGKRQAVLLSYAEWERLLSVPSFGRLLMAAPLSPEDLPRRDRRGLRPPGLLSAVYLVDTDVISAPPYEADRERGGNREFRRLEDRSTAKRIEDAQDAIDRQAVLHVLRPQCVTAGLQR
jgi:hypothetical protein